MCVEDLRRVKQNLSLGLMVNSFATLCLDSIFDKGVIWRFKYFRDISNFFHNQKMYDKSIVN